METGELCTSGANWQGAFCDPPGPGARLFGGAAHARQRIVVEDRRQPLLGLLQRLPLTPAIVLDLVALDLADAEVIALGMAEIEAADRSAGPHGKAFGQP